MLQCWFCFNSFCRYRALYNYKPQNDDEVELAEGDVVYVMEKCDDGWFVGTSQRTGIFGTFPGNYVAKAWTKKTQDENPIIFHYSNYGKFIFKKKFEKKEFVKLYLKWVHFKTGYSKKMYASMSKQLFNMHSLHILHNDLKKSNCHPWSNIFCINVPWPWQIQKN